MTTPICYFSIIEPDDVSEFRESCITDGKVSCDWSVLESWLNSSIVSDIWWGLTRDERYSIAEKSVYNTLYGRIDYYSFGEDACTGSDGDWLSAACAANGMIKYLKFASPIFEYQDECTFESCYWKWDDVDIEHCYKHELYYDLPCAIVQAKPIPDSNGHSHIMCAIQIEEDVSKLDSWVIFQWTAFDIQPGEGQLDCGSFDIYRPGRMGARGGGRRTYFVHVDIL